MRFYRLGLLVITMRLVLLADSGNCPDGSPGTTVVFVNGIETTRPNAQATASFLGQTLWPLLSPALRRCTVVTYLWNTHGSLIGDLYESARQDIGDNTSLFYRWLSNLDNAQVWFKVLFEHFAAGVDGEEYVNIQDLANHVSFYQRQINDDRNTVVVVPHSQGNFFANESYLNLADMGMVLPDPSKFNIVAVATPASVVEGYASGRELYTTLCEDFIWRIPGALDNNLVNNVVLCALMSKLNPLLLEPLTDALGIWKHDFVNSYLGDGTNSESVILGNILDFIDRKPPPPVAAFTMSSGPQTAINGQTLNLDVGTSNAKVQVTFSGDRSTAAAGKVVAWAWTIDGVAVSNSNDIVVPLAEGTHSVSLRVTDNVNDVSPIASGIVVVNQEFGTLHVGATLNGMPWSGTVSYTITCASQTLNETAVPISNPNISSGKCTISNVVGRPANSTLNSVSPSTSQTLAPSGAITFTLEFTSQPSLPITLGTFNAGAWSGNDYVYDWLPFSPTVTGQLTNVTSQLFSCANGQCVGPAYYVICVFDPGHNGYCPSNGSVLATSDPTTGYPVSPNTGSQQFTFSGANQITLIAGQTYYVQPSVNGGQPLAGGIQTFVGVPSQRQVVFSNIVPLGFSIAFNWVIGTGCGHWAPSCSAQQSVASSFVPTETTLLNTIELFVGYFGGPDELTVYIASGETEPGPPLETFTFTNLPNAFSLLTATSTKQPQLTSGSRYWVVLTTQDLLNTNIGWPWSDPVVFGPTATIEPNGPWQVSASGILGTFAVTGTPTGVP